ncbi:MAG: UDP-N-acetylmuramoyl-L-alanine--D-glutamate ligase [Clostridia bacterium]|nr:UDP-N-acetylmuramoyl-L-alanine--D-glutamate ligase [Clostridia bacterium]
MDFVNTKLEEFNNYLDGRRVAIIGLGVSNIPLIEYMHEVGAETVVFDKRELDKIDHEIINKVICYDMEYSLGNNYLDKLVGFDIIFRSPSCLPTTPELKLEASRGAIITTEIEMFMELCPGTIFGVTGSDGKTTTTSLIYEILKAKGYNTYLGGNIGCPLFTKVKEIKPEDMVVLELSSFQLMNMKISPKVAIVTNITPNHLNIHEDMEEYIEAKKCIINSQNKESLVVLNYDNDITRDFAKDALGEVVFFSHNTKISKGYMVDQNSIKFCNGDFRTHILETKNMQIKGIHNYMNAACSIAATKDYVDLETAVEAICNFKGVEHRLELVKQTKDRIKWYNDSASSSPTRTIVGLNSFPTKNVILIAGGYDKNLEYEPIAKPIVNSCKSIILIGQTADKIEKVIRKEIKNGIKEVNIYRCETLEETVLLANKIATKGDAVLFSPASASFDMFKNFDDRGKQFKALVQKYID